MRPKLERDQNQIKAKFDNFSLRLPFFVLFTPLQGKNSSICIYYGSKVEFPAMRIKIIEPFYDSGKTE
jgi:hypothetical protein